MFKPLNFEEKFFYLIAQIIRIVRKETSYQVDSKEPSMIQLQAMMEMSDSEMTMSEIASSLSVKLPTATSLVNRLVESGYAIRLKNKKDRRIIKITLSKKGKKTLINTFKLKIKRMKFVFDKISAKDKKNLYSILDKLHKQLI